MPKNRTGDTIQAEIYPLGDSAAVVRFGSRIGPETHARVRALCASLERRPFPGLVEFVPAYATVTVFYNPMELRNSPTGEKPRYGEQGCPSPHDWVCAALTDLVNQPEEGTGDTFRLVEIPVCYGGVWGPDLDEVARHNGLTAEETIEIHAGGTYTVYMIGFAPGFPYLGGMSGKIAAPRRSTPRIAIPAGSVGIGGRQTGVYPISTPGGWQLIGRTPLRLFRPDRASPSLLKAGDTVRFRRIGPEEFEAWKEEDA